MTTTSNSPLPLLPARRRRHARLIAALTTLIGACAGAAGEVYGPIAAAPPDQEGVAVETLSCIRVAMSAPLLLDMARSEDAARWPEEVVREDAASRRTYAARCALADAHDAVHRTVSGPGRGPVPLPTVESGAWMELVSAGDEVAACWRDDPQQAAVLVRELTEGGELVVDEVLDAAVDAMVVCGLLALAEARTKATVDASAAAELCLTAVPYLARAVTLASVDLD
ncbi:hypothetical protein [Streptomyces sp. CAI 127]|uniref:hypothetical protein n=1 Tax=Streptomyces sp. CAI 127 TaxID=1076397 RepID=UPI001587ACDE|nr:hypothetical protein [Streptomyces sp. CAI 127]NUW02896.1 hypothetical protein [Streptomyces sp. CAI 127]